MSQEIELKLTISRDSISTLQSLPVLSALSADQFTLENTYFDTEDKLLTQAGSALRIRKTPKGYLQTLKHRGRNIGGLHQREEWELPIAEPKLALELFPQSAIPEEISADSLQPLFKTDFSRTRWLITYQQSEIELVLDEGQVQAGDQTDAINELELELKSGSIADLFSLALEISQQVAVMPSDISKAERGYRLIRNAQDVSVELPDIVPQQSMESAFYALFGYEMERLQRSWQVFWSTQQWSHLQTFLVTLGNMGAELEWFESMLPDPQRHFVQQQIDWISAAVKPILSWWPACFALSQDADQQPQTVALSLQQSKAKKALHALQELQLNPELGYRILTMTSWLHRQGWQQGRSDAQLSSAEQPVSDGLDYCFDKALNAIQDDCFVGSVSHALSQSPAVHRLLMLCRYFDRLYGEEKHALHSHLQELDDNLSRLSAIDVVTRLKDWLNHLPFEQQASISSWTRSQPVLLRDIKQLANKLLRGRQSHSGAVV